MCSAADVHRRQQRCSPRAVGTRSNSSAGTTRWQSMHSPAPVAEVTGPRWRAVTLG